MPNLRDLKQMIQRILWSIGLGPPPAFDRWTCFEKFDFWAVYWGLSLLALTGLMLMYHKRLDLLGVCTLYADRMAIIRD